MVPVKQIIVVRKDLKMSKGKMAAQVAHASLAALFTAMDIGKFSSRKKDELWSIVVPNDDSPLSYWLNESFTKVVLEVSSEEALLELKLMLDCQSIIPYAAILDEGRTEFDGETFTCIGIGPYWSEIINKFTGNLKLYKDEEADFYLKRRIAELEEEVKEKEEVIDNLSRLIPSEYRI